MKATFSGNQLTLSMKMDALGFYQYDDWMYKCGYSVEGSKVKAVPPVDVNPKLKNLGGGFDNTNVPGDNNGGSGDDTIFTIVDGNTLRDTGGSIYKK
jgi:hypothetical protein